MSAAIVDDTTARASARPLIRGRALVFLALVLSAFTLRSAVTSMSPLFGRISSDLNFGPGVIGLLGMVPTLMFAVFGVATPAISRRIGLEWTALAAMIAATVGIGLRALAPDVVTLLGVSTLALAGLGIGNVVIPPLVKRYFSDRLALMSTVYICFLQLSTIVPALTAVPAADAGGWRFSIGMWSLAAFAAVLPWIGVLLMRRGTPAEPAAVVSDPHTPIAVWRSSLGWGMATMFAMTSMITYAMLTWLPELLVEAGAGEQFAGASVAVFGAMGLLVSFVAPTLCERMRNPYPIVVGCAAFYLAGFAGLMWSPGTATMLWVVLLGLGPTTFPMSLTLINLRTRTPAGSAALSGFTQGVGYTIACAGPLLFGLLHSATGGWGFSLGFLACGVAVLLVGAFAACRPRLLEDEPRV
ncbi:putative MFS transporter [Rhodococcoides trifolii]|uniref:MFS transporter n=1 Tax=Rhodococcoides trifolii TaxID=908250 RepID=A0A917D6A4_9NOCA|nr:MFS transporter [Rhodococcus trifolii]GGG12328.1 putative MFS transporter [Rhodococcus trifolii]